MLFRLKFTEQAKSDYEILLSDAGLSKRLKAVRKTLGYLELNPRHPSLNTHEYSSISAPDGSKVFEAYAENNTPAAYRIFWHYGPDKNEITIIAITPHP